MSTPKDPTLEVNLSTIGSILSQVMPPDHSFVLMVFGHDTKGDTYYISDLERSDSTELMNRHLGAGVNRELVIPKYGNS